jgi:hypothetical protein
MADDLKGALAVNQAGTASTTGTYLDLMPGTNAQAQNITTADQLGAAGGAMHNGIPLVVTIYVSGSSGTPNGAFSLYQCDDTAATGQTLVGTAVTVTADGRYQITGLNGVRKRFLRLDYVRTAGTIPYSAYIGVATGP